ncbi:hypothetical protein MMC18_002139 [Xylographa bjoerkii]|nr:hypothetical protein [Xylographa bjoerkii]
MAHRGGILIDTRPVPRIGKRDLRFFPRQDGSLFGSTTATPLSTSGGALASTATPSAASILSSSTIPSSSSSANSSSTSTSPSLMTASAVPTNEPLPRPFDTSLGSNFTNSACPAFFNSFLNNATFSSCLPFSLLLQNSNSFFQAEKSPILLTQTLDATCKANFATCTSLMSTLAVELRDDANCGEDYSNENALVVQAYDGLVSYPTLYQAGCLKDSHGNYCFANAITNTSSPSDPYPYFLPLGFALPGGSSPTCSSCLQQTMNIFAGAASNLSQPVSSDYNNAAIQINEVCGPTFVNATVKAIQGTQPSNSAAMQLDRATVTTLLLALVAGLLVVWG